MSSGPEFTKVESLFINQFIAIVWKLVTGNLDRLVDCRSLTFLLGKGTA